MAPSYNAIEQCFQVKILCFFCTVSLSQQVIHEVETTTRTDCIIPNLGNHI